MAHRECWLCGRNGSADPLDRHHIFGGARKELSEKYGLMVDLCHHDCHIFGSEAVHNNKENMQKLHEYGQRLCMERHGMSKEEFIYLFGKNYLSEDERGEVRHSGGSGSFRVLATLMPF